MLCCRLLHFCIYILDAQRIRYISPHRGSSNGGTRITIVGEGKGLSLEVGRY